MGRTACTEPQCLYKGALYLFYYFKLAKPTFRQVSEYLRHHDGQVRPGTRTSTSVNNMVSIKAHIL